MLHHRNNQTEQYLGKSILESLDVIILSAHDAISSLDKKDIEHLVLMTGDRSDIMERVRRKYFKFEQELSQADRNFIFDVTILFENAVLTLARYGEILKS
jgi:uncharacterized LabA/DUF88 family protein